MLGKCVCFTLLAARVRFHNPKQVPDASLSVDAPSGDVDVKKPKKGIFGGKLKFPSLKSGKVSVSLWYIVSSCARDLCFNWCVFCLT